MKHNKSKYPETYRDGIVHRSISISSEANFLLETQLPQKTNASTFINDLIFDTLGTDAWRRHQIIADVNKSIEDLKLLGYEVVFNLSPTEELEKRIEREKKLEMTE